MEDLNNVPSTGTFGNSIGQVNQNFGLVKGAIENLEGRTIRSKGLFPTQAALTAAYPSPKVGDYAYVGSGLPATIYDCLVEGTWHNTGQTGGSETIDLGAYSTTAQMNTAIDNGLQGQVGYAECNTDGSTQRKDVVVNGFKLLASGGALHIKMINANTHANATMNISPTSTIVAANTKPLFYNGAQASSENTWGANEIISVFYDGTRFMASNSQGGGGNAEKIKYDNAQSGLAATDVQGAVDEINKNAEDLFQNEGNTDFDIADERGNVLARFSEGGIKVKNFNSANAVSEGDTLWQTDLDITDEDNNSLVEFAGGHLRTKNFDSRFVIQSKWRYKKIAWYGTSIPAGYPNQNNQDVYAYPNIIASKLGATILNKCIPNGVVRSTKYDGTPLSTNRSALSFTNTSSAVNYQNSMLDLIGTDNEPDLFVFDYGVNDIDEDATELNEQLDFSYLGTNTFFGALSFVLYRLYNAKPKARVIVLTHYSNDGIQTSTPFYGKNVWKPMNDAIEEFSRYWSVKLINAREFVGWHNTKPNVNADGSNNMSVYVIDGIHPASGNNVDAVNLLADLYLPYINNFK